MKKISVKRMFKAIEDDDDATLNSILDSDPSALETVGFHNRLVRDKTPLMYAMQCRNFQLANSLLDRGADAAAVMPDGPQSAVLSLCIQFAYCDSAGHDKWIELARRLLDLGADPNTGLWPAVGGFGGIVDRVDLIALLLDRGADPDRQVGNSGNTVRELVKFNRRLHTADVLTLFGMDGADTAT